MTTDSDSNDSELYRTVGPDIAASKEDREQAARIIEIIESLDTLTKEDLYEEYERKYPNTKTFNDERTTGGLEKKYRPAALDIPGFGSERETCGNPIPHICDCCGEVVNIGRTCGQSMCPRCAPKWVLKTAPGIVNNIMGAARMMSANIDGPVYKHHSVISPPEELYIDAEFPEQELISVAQEFMEEIGMQGIALYHSWSGKPNDDGDDSVLEEAEEFKQNHDDDIGEWKKRLFADRDWHGDVREELQHRPHVHLIGACPWFPMGDVTKLTHAETDWVIHRITGKRDGNSSVSLADMRSVARAVVYALSHCAIDTREEPGSKGGETTAKYVFGKKGKEYFNADDRDLEEAKAHCYSVAPTLLGIDKMETSCREEVPEEETDHSDPADQDALDDLEEDGEASSTNDDDEISMRTCHGDLVSIDRADFVDDEEWRTQALFADEAVRAKAEWEEKGGWEGWLERQTGQARLPTDGAESVDSPPPG